MPDGVVVFAVSVYSYLETLAFSAFGKMAYHLVVKQIAVGGKTYAYRLA